MKKEHKHRRVKENVDETTIWLSLILVSINIAFFFIFIFLLFILPSMARGHAATFQILPLEVILGSLILLGSLGLLKQAIKRDKNTPILKLTKNLAITTCVFAIASAVSWMNVLTIALLIATVSNIITYQKAKRLPDYYVPAKGNWLLGHKISFILFMAPLITLITGGAISEHIKYNMGTDHLLFQLMEKVIVLSFLFWFITFPLMITIGIITPYVPILNRKTKDRPVDLLAYTYILFIAPILIGTEAMVPVISGLIVINLAIAGSILSKTRKTFLSFMIMGLLTLHVIITAIK